MSSLIFARLQKTNKYTHLKNAILFSSRPSCLLIGSRQPTSIFSQLEWIFVVKASFVFYAIYILCLSSFLKNHLGIRSNFPNLVKLLRSFSLQKRSKAPHRRIPSTYLHFLFNPFSFKKNSHVDCGMETSLASKHFKSSTEQLCWFLLPFFC